MTVTTDEPVVPRRERAPRRPAFRRTLRRWLVLGHRWPSLVLGLVLVVECTSGALLLYEGDYFRATHSELYRHTASAAPLTADEAMTAVDRAQPRFGAAWAARDDDVWIVGNADYSQVYGVDPGSGRVSGPASEDTGIIGFLINLHDCALSCEGYPGHVSWLGAEVPTLGWTALTGITWAEFVLGGLGLLMIGLAVSGLVLWWPGRKKLSHGFRVRTGKGRFARDFDLHNVVGIVALPFVLMWGITGAAFEFPVVENAWLAVTGGDAPAAEDFALTPHAATVKDPRIGSDQAVSAALARVDGRVTFIGRPGEGYDYYEIDLVTGYGSYEHRAIYGGGDAYVLVDAHDATHVKVLENGAGPLANRFYDKYLEPTHFGWNVDGWWRLVWFVLGLAPAALMATGVSTWLFRRGVRRRRRAAAAPR